MYVILSYDISKKRVSKALKICRKYLKHTHRSVFEGEITEAKLQKLKKELAAITQTDTDSVVVYKLSAARYVAKEEIGRCSTDSSII